MHHPEFAQHAFLSDLASQALPVCGIWFDRTAGRRMITEYLPNDSGMTKAGSIRQPGQIEKSMDSYGRTTTYQMGVIVALLFDADTIPSSHHRLWIPNFWRTGKCIKVINGFAPDCTLCSLIDTRGGMDEGHFVQCVSPPIISEPVNMTNFIR